MPIGSRHVWRLAAWAGGSIVGISMVVLVLVGSELAEPASLVAFGLIVVAAWVLVRRSPHRRAAGLLAGALTLTLLGDAIWSGHVLVLGEEPSLSPADAFWVGAHVLLAVALLRMTPGSYRRPTDPDGLVDLAVVFMVVMLLQWELALDGILSDQAASPVERFIWFLYPTFGAAVLALLLRAVFSRQLRGPSVWFLGAGIVMWMGADTAWSMIGAEREVPPALDLLWLAGAVCFMLAIPRVGDRKSVV